LTVCGKICGKSVPESETQSKVKAPRVMLNLKWNGNSNIFHLNNSWRFSEAISWLNYIIWKSYDNTANTATIDTTSTTATDASTGITVKTNTIANSAKDNKFNFSIQLQVILVFSSHQVLKTSNISKSLYFYSSNANSKKPS